MRPADAEQDPPSSRVSRLSAALVSKINQRTHPARAVLFLVFSTVHLQQCYCESLLRCSRRAACQQSAVDHRLTPCLCRAYGGIDVAKYGRLNPLALCGLITPAPGTLVCVGDRLSACGDIHYTVAGDTCSSIEAALGAIVGGNNLICSDLTPSTPVCVRPAANQVSMQQLRAC